jgi:transposase
VAIERVEVITAVERRRRWATRDKLKLVAESYKAAGGIAEVADRVGLHRSLLQRWRRQVRDGELVPEPIGLENFVPVRLAGEAPFEGLPSPAGLPRPGFPIEAGRGAIEIELPNGCRLRVDQDVPAAALRRIIGVLTRR